MNNEELAKVKAALETGVDLAAAHAEETHRAYAGYKPDRHKAVDRDVEDMREALAIVERAATAPVSAAEQAAQSAAMDEAAERARKIKPWRDRVDLGAYRNNRRALVALEYAELEIADLRAALAAPAAVQELPALRTQFVAILKSETSLGETRIYALADQLLSLAMHQPQGEREYKVAGEARPALGTNGGFTMCVFKAVDVPPGAVLFTGIEVAAKQAGKAGVK